MGRHPVRALPCLLAGFCFALSITKAADQPTLLVSASSFEFIAQDAAVQPASQAVFLASNDGSPAYTARIGYWSAATNWLSVSPASGTAPSNLTLSVEPANLANGVYFGYVEISAGSARPVVLNITFRVGNSAAMGAAVSPGNFGNSTRVEADWTKTQRLNPFPESLTFNHQTGTAPPPPQCVVVSSGRAKIGFVAGSSANWLMLSTHRTTTPRQVVQGRGNSYLVISADPSGLSSGTYSASISLSAVGGVEQSLPVTLNVGEHPYLVAGQSALMFSVPTSGEMPLPQTVTIDSTGGTPLNYTASGDASSWLAVGPQFGSTSGSNTISVAVNPSNLPAGIHRGSISVSAPGAAHDLTIPVTVATGKQATGVYGLSANPDTLNFQGSLSGPVQTQTFQLTSSLNTEQFFIYAPPSATWLSVSPSSGTTPATVTVRVDPSKVSAPNTYTGVLDIGGAVDDDIGVIVKFTATAGGTTAAITATPSQVSFSQTSGGAVPASQTVQLSSSTATAFTASSGASWLTVTPTSATTPATLTLSANAAGLNAGSYQTNVTVSGGGTTVTIPVTLTVSSSATGGLTATPTSLQFSQTLGGTGPPSQTFNLSAATATSFSASSGASWLTVTPASGTTPATQTISVNASGLNAGTYQSAVTVTGGGTTVTVPVTLTIASSANGAITATPAQVSFSQALGGAIPASQTVQLSSSTATGFTASSGASWLAVTPTSGTTPATLTLSANASGLNAGTYQSTVTVTGGGTTVTIPVTLTVSSGATGGLTATPTSVQFLQTLGGTGPPSQTVNLSAGTATSFTASSGASWLTVSPTSGTTPATLTFSVSAAGLNVGSYQSAVTVTGGGTTVAIPVTLTVATSATGATGAITATPSQVSFSQALGGAIPASQTVQLSSSTATAFTASSGASWLTVTPISGTTPATLTLSVNAAGLNVGTYQTAVTITAGGTTTSVSVTLTVTSAANGSLTVAPAAVAFSQTLGAGGYVVQLIHLASPTLTSFTASSTATWLTVAPTAGSLPADLILSASAAGLAVGTYQGSITVNAGTALISVPVTLTVAPPQNGITPTPASLSFSQVAGGPAPNSQSVHLDSPVQTNFTAVSTVNWLSVLPTTGTSPADLTFAVNAAGLAVGNYQTSVTINGGAAPIIIPVALVVSSGPAPTITLTPSSIGFSQTLGGTAPASQTVNLGSGTPTNFTTAATASWLTVTPISGTAPATLNLTANAAGLNAGTYQTSVTVNASGRTVSIPVNLTVSSTATGGISNVSPSTLTFIASGGQAPAGQAVSVTSSGAQFAFTTTVRTADNGNWLTVTPASGTTPASLTVTITPTGLAVGQYVGAIAITPADPAIPAQTVGVALTITSSGTASGTPVLRTIVNAASLLPGPLAPGEIVTITGSGLGPVTASGPNLLASGAVDSQVGQTRVLFDGTPAPLLFVSSNQINAIVPYNVFGRLGSNIQVEVAGVRSDPANLRIADTAPAIFTIDGSGRGPGAIINQDGTINSPAFPAPRGSVISMYATGEGQTRPPGQDGRIITTDLRTPMAPVVVRIGGVPVDVRYAGSAPGLVSGALQINVYVPPDMATGGQLPVEIQIGASLSQFGVTMAVK